MDLERQPPHFAIDPLLVLTSIARESQRIGRVTTGSTTFNEPYNLARQLEALDVDAFVDQGVPILQERGLFHLDYEGPTLRSHLGARDQYGLDPRTLEAPAHPAVG